MTNSVHAHALRFGELGLAVLPLHRPVERSGSRVCSCGKANCPSPAKHPVGKLVPCGLLDASRDPQRIASWFGREPWNIGIATGAASGIVVVDIDPRHGGDETIAKLEVAHGRLPLTWRFLSGGGGEHIIFCHPGRVVKNSVGQVGRGIDMRGDGGYIVAPPSLHIGGRPYAISVDHHPDEVPLAPLPAWLLNLIAEPKPATAAAPTIARTQTEWRARFTGPVDEGRRNIAIARLAGLLLGRRIDPHTCLDLVLAFNAARCRPPLSDREVVSTVASIARRELAGRRLRRKEHARE